MDAIRACIHELKEERDQLREESKRLKKDRIKRQAASDQFRRERDAARALLRQLLDKGSHWEGCDESHGTGPCSCGYAGAVARAERHLAGDRQAGDLAPSGSTPDAGTHAQIEAIRPGYTRSKADE